MSWSPEVKRWWTPHSAKFFIYFEPYRYMHFGDASTGKARGFQLPGARPNPTVVQNYSPAPAYSPPSESYAPPRNSMVEVQSGMGGGMPFLFPFFRNP